MKNLILSLSIIACVALGILAAEQQQKLGLKTEQLAAAQQQLQAAQAELKEKAAEIEDAKLAEQKNKILQKTLTESTSEVAAQSKKSEQLQQSLAEAKTNNPLHSMAAIFKDPGMREMMKAQQKAVLGPMIAKQYADLFKQLNLTQEQSAALKELIQNRMLVGADVGMALMDDSLDASKRADLTKQIKDQTDDINNQIKQLVGDDNYQAFQSYEKTVPDRMSVGQFSDQFAGTPNALSDTQQQQLIQAMSDARNSFNWTSGLNQQNAAMNSDMGSLLTDDNINKFEQEREQFDNQFLSRAQSILTPDQLNAFKDFQVSQLKLQLAGLKMAASMYNPQK